MNFEIKLNKIIQIMEQYRNNFFFAYGQTNCEKGNQQIQKTK